MQKWTQDENSGIHYVPNIIDGHVYRNKQIIYTQNAFLRLGNRVCYKLVGVVRYISLQLGGHYVCYFLDHGQNQWFYANDDKVITSHMFTSYIIILYNTTYNIPIRYHQWLSVKSLSKIHFYFSMNCVVRIIRLIVKTHHELFSYILLADGNIPALTLDQCARVSSNQWFTDEVKHSSCMYLCILLHVSSTF